MARKKKLTERAEKVMSFARDEADRMGSPFVTTGHLMLALLREGEGVGIALLANLDVDVVAVTDVDLARSTLHRLFGVTPIGTGGRDVTDDDGPLKESQVEWVVNDLAELGVKIKGQFFWCYKGRSLTYGAEESGGGIALHDDGTPMHWRPVWNREFGECVHPLNYRDPTKYGTVSLEDSDEWKTLPAPPPKGGET